MDVTSSQAAFGNLVTSTSQTFKIFSVIDDDDDDDNGWDAEVNQRARLIIHFHEFIYQLWMQILSCVIHKFHTLGPFIKYLIIQKVDRQIRVFMSANHIKEK